MLQKSPRIELLNDAMGAVIGDRNNQYGPPTQDFDRTAAILNALGYRAPNNTEMMPHDVALLVIAVKMSRLMWSPMKRDSWLDIAGYAACGWECMPVKEGSNASNEKEG